MLGTFGTSAFRVSTDFNNHKDYLQYMYGNAKGFITRSVIPQDRDGAYMESFAFADRLINRNSYFDVTNVYTSMNTFLTRRNPKNDNSGRKVSNLKELNALYLDLDCYKIGMTQEQVLFELEQEVFGHEIPVPTFVINSGRGLYLIWKISEDRNALPRWTSVQRYLFEKCKNYNADPQALDAARILRVPFSVNGKNGSTVEIMQFNDVKYNLHDIIKEYDIKKISVEKVKKSEPTYPYGEATAKQRLIAQWQSIEFKVNMPNFENYQETFNFIEKYSNTHRDKAEKNNVIIFSERKSIAVMLDGRIKDLFKLFSLREGGDCSREYALFLCRLWAGERTNDFEYALQQTQALNRTFDVPFDEKYVSEKTKSAETKLKTGKTYRYKLSTIIRALSITETEQEELNYLCTQTQAVPARRRKSNRRAYLTRLEKEDKQTKGTLVLKRRKSIAQMIAEGKQKKDICSMLEISTRTFDRDKAAIIADGLLSRARAAFQHCADTVVATVQNATERATEAIHDVAEVLISTVKTAKERLSPFFQSTNYKRTPKGCSACAVAPIYEQLSFFDLWDKLGIGDTS